MEVAIMSTATNENARTVAQSPRGGLSASLAVSSSGTVAATAIAPAQPTTPQLIRAQIGPTWPRE
jgi:hypothetical protein